MEMNEKLERLIALNPRQNKEQTRAFIKECPLQDYGSLTKSPGLKQLEQRINGSQDEEEQRKLKSWLPFRCPHYTQFRDDYRDREHIVAESFSWQTCIDIDDPALVEKANEMSERLDMEAGGHWQGLMLHKDYSIRRKLHIDIRLPLGMTVPEAQREYCKALGVECDTSCFTPERFIYISPADFEIYRSDGWYSQLSEEEVAARRKAYTDRGLSIDGRTEDGSYYDPGDDGDAPTPAPAAPAAAPDAPAEKAEKAHHADHRGCGCAGNQVSDEKAARYQHDGQGAQDQNPFQMFHIQVLLRKHASCAGRRRLSRTGSER